VVVEVWMSRREDSERAEEPEHGTYHYKAEATGKDRDERTASAKFDMCSNNETSLSSMMQGTDDHPGDC
jgi:hypothetical protein